MALIVTETSPRGKKEKKRKTHILVLGHTTWSLQETETQVQGEGDGTLNNQMP